MKLQEVTLYENRSHRILKEGWHDLTEAQQNYQLRWEKELFPLLEQYVKLAEAELTPDQIQAIFKSAEANAMASGNNKTALGKAGAGAAAVAGAAGSALKLPVDIAKKVDAKVKELFQMAQDTGPIKNADAKFEELKKKITAENSDSKIVQGIQKISDWAKENPGKASLAVGILTTIASFVGGPAGGFAAGVILRATKDLLQGEKLSTAVGKSIKTGIYGALAGMTFNYLGDKVAELIGNAGDEAIAKAAENFELKNVQDYKDSIPDDVMQVMTGGENLAHIRGSVAVSVNGQFSQIGISQVLNPAQEDKWFALIDAFKQSPTAENFAKAVDFKEMIEATTDQSLLRQAMDAAKEVATSGELGTDQLETLASMGNNLQDKVDFIKDLSSAAGAAAQGAAQAHEKENVEKIKPPKETPKEESINMELEFNRYLAEAGFADMIKGAGAKVAQGAKAAGGAIAKGAKAAGKELGNKVTYNKMMSAWKKAGNPTDTGSIINILQGLGLSDSEIGAVGREANVKLTKVTNKPGEKDQAGSGDIQQRMEKFAADVKKHNLQKEVIAMLNAQGDVQQPTKQTGGAGKAGTQQGGYDTTVTQKKQQPAKPKLSTSGASMNPAYN